MNAPVLTVESPAKRRLALGRNAIVVAAVALLVAVAGIAWLMAPPSSESTDNAYVKADSSLVAPKVGGLVAAVLVKDNQRVRAGDPLVRIDPQEFEAKVAAAEAAVADARAGVLGARAALAALAADEALAAAQVRATATAIAAANAELTRATADRARFEALSDRGFATRRDAERVLATEVAARSNLDRSQANLGVSSEQSAVTHARRPILVADLAKAEAVLARARAALDLARQDRGHALVLAPIDGVVGNRRVQTGDYVQPGSQLMSVVPLHALYVIANFKETQTRDMHPGQAATIAVDALGGQRLTGRVESFAPGSGSEFTLLPFEPGSGNFTKIVQRVGVRIRLDEKQPAFARLRPGLSVTARVTLR